MPRHTKPDPQDDGEARVHLPKDYDPADFLIPSKDSKGHSETVHARVQPGHAHQLTLMVRSRLFPYKTESDIVRHALDRHLKWLDSFQEPITDVMRQTKLMVEVMKDQQFQVEFQIVINGLNSMVQQLQEAGAHGEVAQLVSKELHLVEEMPDGYWRDKYRKEITDKYGHWLTGQGASLKRNGNSGGGKVKK